MSLTMQCSGYSVHITHDQLGKVLETLHALYVLLVAAIGLIPSMGYRPAWAIDPPWAIHPRGLWPIWPFEGIPRQAL